ncbi:MAG: TetR/AcrR family transcriptional regulator [Leptonema sp. (in: bacteria)]
MGLREDKKKQNREDIVNSARKVFVEKGFHHTSITDIIRGTGLSRSTFYLYFKNKEEIFAILLHQLYQNLLSDLIQLNKEVKINKYNIKSNIEKNLISLFKTLYHHQDLIKIIIETPTKNNSEFNEIIKKYQRIFLKAIRDLLERGKQYKILRIENIEIASYIIFGALKEIINNLEVSKYTEKEIEEQIMETLKIFQNGLLK